MRLPRMIRRLFVVSTVVGAVLAWRERQIAKNTAKFAPPSDDAR